jgi:hypothetical protein
MPQSEECCQSLGTPRRCFVHCPAGVGETTPPLGRFQGRSSDVLTRNGRRLAVAPIHRFLHNIVCKSMYTPTPSPHRVSTVAVRIYPINTTNMCALIKLQLPLIFVLPTRDVHGLYYRFRHFMAKIQVWGSLAFTVCGLT